jgi:hypothetical protein
MASEMNTFASTVVRCAPECGSLGLAGTAHAFFLSRRTRDTIHPVAKREIKMEMFNSEKAKF